MRIALLADIHANHPALLSCLNMARDYAPDLYILLGDYVTDCAYPERTMQALYDLQAKHPCLFIRGNREDYLLAHQDGAPDGWAIPSSSTGSLMYTFQRLQQVDFDFFRAMDIQGTLAVPGFPHLAYCHGTPQDSRGMIVPQSEKTQQMLAGLGPSYMVRGHTHLGTVLQLEGKTIISAGSVGLPVGTPGLASFAVLDSSPKAWRHTFLFAPFDVAQSVRQLYEGGLMQAAPVWGKLVERSLVSGDDPMPACLRLVQDIARQKGLPWPTEECWQLAAQRLGLA